MAGIALYATFAVLIYWPVVPWSSSRLVMCGCYDPATEVWWLTWTPFALLHHLSLFGTSYLNYPTGVNLAQQTDPLFLGIAAAPITYTLGPVAALNLLYRLSFVLSATSMMFVLRRWTTWWPAAFFGGLLYGFGPYMVAQGSLHFTLIAVPIPPMIFAVLDELLIRQRRNPRNVGLLLGLLAILQYFISPEILASTGLMALAGVVILLVVRPRQVRTRLRYAVTGTCWSLLVFVVVCGYPIYYLLAGPRRITGPLVPASAVRFFSGDLLSPFVPTVNQRFGTAHLKAIGSSFVFADIAENGAYLGIPLVLVLIGLFWKVRGLAKARLAAALLVVASVLVLGVNLAIDNKFTSLALPYDLLLHVPLLQSSLPIRYTLFVDLFAAILLAIGCDGIVKARREHAGNESVPTTDRITDPAMAHLRASSRDKRRRWTMIGTIVLVGFVFAPLIPSGPYVQPPIGMPQYFNTAAALKKIPAGSVVLTYPFPNKPQNQAMLWQAVSLMRFKLIGGYGTFPAPGGGVSLFTTPLAPPTIETLFSVAMNGPAATGQPAPPANDATLQQMRQYCSRYQVDTILLQLHQGVDPHLAVAYLRAAFGRPAVIGGTYVWYHVQRDLKKLPPGFSVTPSNGVAVASS